MDKVYALERTVHFLIEKRNKPYKWYGDVSIADKKCAGCQELPQSSQLCWLADGRGA